MSTQVSERSFEEPIDSLTASEFEKPEYRFLQDSRVS